MIKLTRSGWNNVIIFAVMAFIFLIHLTQSDKFALLEKNMSTEQQYLLGEHGLILSMTVNQQTYIERIGQTWRAMPAVISGQPLTAMMQSWHDTQAQIIEKPAGLTKEQGIIVSLVLAGQAEAEYFVLFTQQQRFIIYRQQHQLWLELPMPMFNQLIPKEVLI